MGGITIAEKEEEKRRNFALRDQAGNESGVHIFRGESVQVNKPTNAPAWMPDKIWKPKITTGFVLVSIS